MSHAVKDELNSWKADSELSKIVRRLEAVSRPDQFLDCFAEYAIARRFVVHGCQVEVEVATARGRNADLKASKGSSCLYAHVKRLNPEQKYSRQEKLEPLFAPLEKLKRPIHVQLDLNPDLTHEQAQAVIKIVRPFLLRASKGEEMTLSDNGVNMGIARILGEGEAECTMIWVHFGMQENTDRDRLPKKFSQAYGQFMPKATNVVFVAWNQWETDHELYEFENVLLGTTWGETVFDSSMQPRTVRSGRKSDGFWSGDRHPDSQAACCFRFLISTGDIEHKLWIRDGCKDQIPEWFNELFS